MRNAFGALIVCPSRLTRVERIDELRRISGRLLADSDLAARWLGERLAAWLRDGGRLESHLGVVAARGSRRTPQRILLAEQQRHQMLRLSVALGSDRRAGRVLRGEEPAPPHLAAEVQQARELKCPSSGDAFVRARRHGR
jgi:hypothetical protein